VVLILILGQPVQEYLDEIIFYASMAAISTLIVYFINEHKNRFYAFIRLLYPGFMFTFFYRETGGLMFLLYDDFFDWQLTTFEKIILGINPTIYIDNYLLNVWLNEFFSFCYFAYYFMIIIFLLIIFFKKDFAVIKSFLSATCITFFVSYLLFFLYPIEGPRWYFAGEYNNLIDGPVFRQLAEFVIANGAVRGGCMPSSHFGVALVIIMYCYKYYRKAYWILLPMVIGLAVGTVWGRYHYISDVLIGGLIGLVAVLIIWKYYDVKLYDDNSTKPLKELTA
ncbi:MAG: phosphatase PAP2 family protein, partial [Candidatus Zixiibacteriota bacterium]